jgi:hypothetical protein
MTASLSTLNASSRLRRRFVTQVVLPQLEGPQTIMEKGHFNLKSTDADSLIERALILKYDSNYKRIILNSGQVKSTPQIC